MASIFSIKVVPGSGKQQWSLDKAGSLKCHLKNQAERGLANKELIAALAKACKVPLIDVVIIGGTTHRKKTVKIMADITFGELLIKLGIEKQQSIDFIGTQRK